MAGAYKSKQARDDDTRARRGRPPKPDSEVTSELLATGEATMAQLAQLFSTDSKSLPQRLKGVIPSGKNRRGYKVYNIAEAASRIVRPGYEIEEYIRQMSPQELPPLLSKEFWNGQNARIKHEREVGNLWPTEQVVEAFSAGLSAMRMSILLTQDAVEREAALTDKQREAIQRLVDSAINDAREAIETKMKDFDLAHKFEDDGEVHELDGADDIESDDFNILASSGDEEEDIGI